MRTCDHCQKVKHLEQTDYGLLCEPCYRQAIYDDQWGEPQ